MKVCGIPVALPSVVKEVWARFPRARFCQDGGTRLDFENGLLFRPSSGLSFA